MTKEISGPQAFGGMLADLVDSSTRHSSLRIVYSLNRPILNGVDLRPSAVSSPPRVYVGDDLRAFFTLVLVDADFPSPSSPTRGEYLHWLVAGIPGSRDSSFGQEIMGNEGPHPTAGIHRLVFILFKQRKGQVVLVDGDRKNFNVRAFAEQNCLGPPVGGVYFNCQRENGTGGGGSGEPGEDPLTPKLAIRRSSY